ncbi:unnamed protein product, partial [Symbiodinium pilosum]
MAEPDAAPMSASSGNILVFRGWGADKPGICQAFLGIVVEHQSEVLDMAQFLLGGGLMFTFVLKVADQSSIGLMKSLTSCAREQGLQLNFHFPDAGEVPEAEGGNEAVISVVSASMITPALMFDIDKVLWGHGCVVLEIEHRSDNMKEHNNEYNKVQIRIRCPVGLRLASLMMGPAGGEVEGLQKVAWEHGGEVTARWWDAMNRPNGKSLVVFGLSNVLCPDDVLDLVLREAGVDPASVKSESSQPGAEESAKLAMLKGHSTQLVRKVIDQLAFTPGAKVVCSAMKRLGCRLAILTNTGMREVAEHVKSQLGFDYVICRDVEVEDGCFTGRYMGELSDVKFRKADLLKLMAEREGVDYRNVITVGEPLTGLKAANARLMLETFGPFVFFNSTKMPDLTIVLYLLGFSGSDVRALRKRRWDDGPGMPEPSGSAVPPTPASKRFMVQVSAQNRSSGQLQRIFHPLAPLRQDVQLTTVRQCSLQDGGMCLGLDLTVQKDHPDAVVKELVYTCQKEGFAIMDVNDSAKDFNWQLRYQNRYVVTLVQKPNISSTSLSEVMSVFGSKGINIIKIERLSSRDIASLQFTVSLPDSLSSDEFSRHL